MADPQSKADIDPNFEKRLRELKEYGTAAQARGTGGQVKWLRPADSEIDPFDLESIGEPYSRDEVNEQMLDAIKDPASPGTVGDVIACTTQIARLATMERAMRVRYTLRRPRAVAHTLARQKGHGNDKGPIVQLGIAYVQAVIKQSKAEQS
jgi:hypothetical protein